MKNHSKQLSPSKTVLFTSIFFFGMGGILTPSEASAENFSCSVRWTLATCQPASFRSHGKTYMEMEEDRRIARIQAEARRRANAWPTAFVDINDDIKNPNSVKIPFAQAPGISAKTREENGRRVCESKNDKGNKSKQKGKGVHIDKECCLDPDEIPNPRCYYPQLGANNSPERIVNASGKKVVK